MAVRTTWFTMDNKLGVDLNKVIASVTVTANPSQPEYPGIPHNLGDRVQGNGGSEWMFVQASTTVTTYNAIGIDKNFQANNLTISFATNTVAQHVYGVAQVKPRTVSVGAANGGVINPGEFFWALMKANVGARINLSAAMSVDGPSALYIGTAGVLVTAASCRVNGIEAVGTAGPGSAAAEVVFFSYMMPAFIVSASAVSA